jgi:hypothetical protein
MYSTPGRGGREGRWFTHNHGLIPMYIYVHCAVHVTPYDLKLGLKKIFWKTLSGTIVAIGF